MSTILHILQHALGRDEYGRPRSASGEDYRNHYVTGEACDSYAACEEAERQGLMQRHARSALSGGDWVFTVTDAGRAYIAEHSPKPPKVSRSRARYLRWLNSAAADCGVAFGDWLRAGS